MRLLIVSLCFWACALAAPAKQQHMLVAVSPTTDAHVALLRDAHDTDFELDFWTHPMVGKLTDIRVPAARFQDLQSQWADAGMDVTVRIENVEEYDRNLKEADELFRKIQPYDTAQYQTSLSHNAYRNYDDVVNAVNTLANTFPNLVTYTPESRSDTIEGRTIVFFEVGANRNAPVIFMEVNIHAREWITGASNLYMMDWLVTNYASNADAKFILDNYRIVNIPISNPDGFVYTWSNDRYWRKNRRHCSGTSYGVDLNRNFDYQWGLSSGSSNLCSSDSYRGSSAGSEPETARIKNLFLAYESACAIYLSVHAYSQLILLPWSWSSSATAFNTWHRDVGNAMAAAMTSSAGLSHTAGTAQTTIGYTASGTTADWALSRKMGSDTNFLALAYEMRPNGSGLAGFNIAASNIVPAGRELLASMVALVNAHYNRVNG